METLHYRLRILPLKQLPDTERDGCPAHVVRAPCGGGDVLAHARSALDATMILLEANRR